MPISRFYALVCVALPLLSAEVSPAERKIATAHAAIAKNPGHADAYADLGLALAMRARETSDTAFYEKGLEAATRALSIDPQNYSALRTRTWILLGKHQFADALAAAQALQKRSGDDVMVYGFLSDAYTELGRYPEAEKATQWMLDLRPGNIPALTRAAHLRELFGDSEGAVELINMALRQLAPAETENRAWLLVQASHLRLAQGRLPQAEQLADHALKTFPGYHYALGQLAQIRRAQKRYSEAVAFEQSRLETAPHAENRFQLAVSLALAGEKAQARQAFRDFERTARAEMNSTDNANHELVFYYTDHARKPKEALQVARLEFVRRQDVHTLHAYAWALHCAGRPAEAHKHMGRALAVGIQDAEMFRHAADIAVAAKDRATAARYRRQAAELAPARTSLSAGR